MGRPRKPTRILELNGAFKKDPQRNRGSEPMPAGTIGDPPKCFKRKALKDIWWEVIEQAPQGVLTNADRIHLEMVCQLLDEFRSSPERFVAARMTRLEAMLGKIGMNPSDRTRLTGVSKGECNPFADL